MFIELRSFPVALYSYWPALRKGLIHSHLPTNKHAHGIQNFSLNSYQFVGFIITVNNEHEQSSHDLQFGKHCFVLLSLAFRDRVSVQLGSCTLSSLLGTVDGLSTINLSRPFLNVSRICANTMSCSIDLVTCLSMKYFFLSV